MTHLEGVIREVKKFVPRPSRNKQIKNNVLRKLYAIEAMEARTNRPVRRIKVRPSITSSAISGLSAFLKRRAERKKEQRLQRAFTVKKIRESNLPEEKKQTEQSKLGVKIFKVGSNPQPEPKPEFTITGKRKNVIIQRDSEE